MAKCEFCEKGVTFGIKVSHSHRRANRPWKPNVKRVKAIVNGTPRHATRLGDSSFHTELRLLSRLDLDTFPFGTAIMTPP